MGEDLRIDGYAGLGQGQRITKRETESTESDLKVKQKRILSAALRKAYLWLILTVLLIGPDLGVVVGYAALALGTLRLLRTRWARWDRLRWWLIVAVAGGLGVVWYLYGWYWVQGVWPPLYFVEGWAYLRHTRVLPAPGWVRVVVIGLAALPVLPELALGLEMVVELFDSSWPPAYDTRDPNRGPWMPWSRAGDPDVGGEPQSKGKRADPDGPIPVRFMVPVTDHTDLEAVREYGARDASRAGNGFGNGVGD